MCSNIRHVTWPYIINNHNISSYMYTHIDSARPKLHAVGTHLPGRRFCRPKQFSTYWRPLAPWSINRTRYLTICDTDWNNPSLLAIMTMTMIACDDNGSFQTSRWIFFLQEVTESVLASHVLGSSHSKGPSDFSVVYPEFLTHWWYQCLVDNQIIFQSRHLQTCCYSYPTLSYQIPMSMFTGQLRPVTVSSDESKDCA